MSDAFSLEEVETALKSLKNGKVPGNDNVHTEFLKNLSNLLAASFHLHLHQVSHQSGKLPKSSPSWSQQMILRVTVQSLCSSIYTSCLKDYSWENQQHRRREASYYPSRFQERQIHHWPSCPACQWHRGGLPGEPQVWCSVCSPHRGVRHCVAPWAVPQDPSDHPRCETREVDHAARPRQIICSWNLKRRTQQEEKTSQCHTTRFWSRSYMYTVQHLRVWYAKRGLHAVLLCRWHRTGDWGPLLWDHRNIPREGPDHCSWIL